MRTLKKIFPIIQVVGSLLLIWVFFYFFLWWVNDATMYPEYDSQPPMWGYWSPTTPTIGFIISARIDQAVKKRREKKASEWNGNYWRDDDYS